jgi:hypothetical protein
MAKFAIVATVKTVPGKRDEYLKHLKAHAQRCLATEPGTLKFEILVPQKPTRSCCTRSMPARKPSKRTGRASPCNRPSRTRPAYKLASAACVAISSSKRQFLERAEYYVGTLANDLFRAACRMELERIVSKHRERPYQAGRSRHWLKVKNRMHPAMERVTDAFR